MLKNIWLVILILATFSAECSNRLNMGLLIDGKLVTGPDAPILQAGKEVNIGFRITTLENNTPVSDLHPGAWVRPRIPERKSCDNAVRNYLAQGPNASQDLSLNGYTFITLNNDNSIAVMDPHLNLATSNLLSLTQLNSRVGDWQLAPDKQALYISLPDTKQIVEINLVTAQITNTIVLEHKPMGLEIFKQYPVVWVASENDGVVYAIDTLKLTQLKQFKIGKGAVTLVPDQKNNRLFAYSAGDGQLIGINIIDQQVIFRIATKSGMTGLAYSPLTNRIYMTHPDLKHLISFKPQSFAQLDKVIIADNGHGLQITPGGRWLLASNGKNGTVSIIDTNNGLMSHVLQFKHPFDQIFFSKHYAYVRHTDNPNVSLVHLPTLQSGVEPGVIEVPFGASAPDVAGELSPLSPIALLPSGHGVVVANPADRTIFLFMEGGMKAPMNAFKTWTATPLSLIVHDHSLQETRPGIYETVTRVVNPGAYEVVFYMPNTSQIQCLPLDVEQSKKVSVVAKHTVHYNIEVHAKNIIAGHSVEIEISIDNYKGESSRTNDLQVLLMRPGNNWQHRSFATLSKKGNFVFSVIFPEPGVYKLLVKSNQLKLNLDQKNLKTIEVSPPN